MAFFSSLWYTVLVRKSKPDDPKPPCSHNRGCSGRKPEPPGQSIPKPATGSVFIAPRVGRGALHFAAGQEAVWLIIDSDPGTIV